MKMYDNETRDFVKMILIKHGINEYKFKEVMKEITIAYDKNEGDYPENQFEGRAFYEFCFGKCCDVTEQVEIDDWIVKSEH